VLFRSYPFFDYIPLSLKDIDKRIYITRARKTSGLDSTYIGGELIEIEGIPTIQYLEKNIFPYISASTEQHLWMQSVYKIQSGFKDQLFRGTIKKRNGEIAKIEIKRDGESTRTENDLYWGPSFNYSRNKVELEWLDDKIALVSINSFSLDDLEIKAFDKIVKELYNAKGVIFDLRNNGGGSTDVAWHLQKYLTKGKFFLNYAWETRINDGVGKANGNWIAEDKDYYLNKAYRFEKPDTIFISDTLKRISCPTALLIGRFTFSAAEDFLVNIFECPNRPLLIGEETGGSTGSPLVISGLPGGGYARICTRRICFPLSGKRFVNSGIKPDIEVKQSIEDYLISKDVVLERAIKEIKVK
jgi:carboxyl-terminal processing protease